MAPKAAYILDLLCATIWGKHLAGLLVKMVWSF